MQRVFVVRTKSCLFDIGMYLEMNGSGTRDDPFKFSKDPILGASSISPGSDESKESGQTIPIQKVVRLPTPRPVTSGQRVKRRGKKGLKRLPAMQPHGGKSSSPYETAPLVAGPSNRIESLSRKMERDLLGGREGTMNKVLGGRMTLVWPREDDDLVVYPEITNVDRECFIRGKSSSLAS